MSEPANNKQTKYIFCCCKIYAQKIINNQNILFENEFPNKTYYCEYESKDSLKSGETKFYNYENHGYIISNIKTYFTYYLSILMSIGEDKYTTIIEKTPHNDVKLFNINKIFYLLSDQYNLSEKDKKITPQDIQEIKKGSKAAIRVNEITDMVYFIPYLVKYQLKIDCKSISKELQSLYNDINNMNEDKFLEYYNKLGIDITLDLFPEFVLKDFPCNTQYNVIWCCKDNLDTDKSFINHIENNKNEKYILTKSNVTEFNNYHFRFYINIDKKQCFAETLVSEDNKHFIIVFNDENKENIINMINKCNGKCKKLFDNFIKNFNNLVDKRN